MLQELLIAKDGGLCHKSPTQRYILWRGSGASACESAAIAAVKHLAKPARLDTVSACPISPPFFFLPPVIRPSPGVRVAQGVHGVGHCSRFHHL